MHSTRSVVPPAIILSVVLVSACDRGGPSAPSATPSAGPAPAPVSQVTSVWNVTTRLTDARGEECARLAAQSQLAAPKSYVLVVTQTGASAVVTLKSASGDYNCTFNGGTADSTGFVFGAVGTYTCEPGREAVIKGFRCANGTQLDLFAFGQNLSGRISGSEISGTWDVDWVDGYFGPTPLETKTEFTGTRQ
ncbi:MAG TPA: hypothetical protein VK886_16990 [Vicinamibacterales bacterium]|nr:hypothetical protein [Vicinamibacterales bacterium]